MDIRYVRRTYWNTVTAGWMAPNEDPLEVAKREDLKTTGLVMQVSTDAGKTWHDVPKRAPTTPVVDQTEEVTGIVYDRGPT